MLTVGDRESAVSKHALLAPISDDSPKCIHLPVRIQSAHLDKTAPKSHQEPIQRVRRDFKAQNCSACMEMA